MRVVEILPKEECHVTAIEASVQDYFNGDMVVVSCILAGKSYDFVCYEEGLQVKNNQVKAIYGPAIVCNAQLEELSDDEAVLVQNYVNENKFDLNNIHLH
ncbi:hypothetical protein [Halalkalibacter akibai]|uniref:Uncharacterized protein n=1 Tax=Halalkalibacter akibai (strain ATCC 43226 / DSM 21942 / CIP 109018 / JCM 9157 / 1139) TaxID=1236973 RepID=W4QYG5_HALA3|nr:hypothetical protein [Halalkalibacter akibai]GAE36922.1 hypothetical protein JCM9157_4158 [Halalkalibacter akibai JCM 9157]